jgi:hypothetical protein
MSNADLRICRLGSGTGLVGLATAAIWQCNVILTDLPAIEPNLSFNVKQNADLVEANGGTSTSTTLDWANADDALVAHGGDQFEVSLLLVNATFLIFQGCDCCGSLIRR